MPKKKKKTKVKKEFSKRKSLKTKTRKVVRKKTRKVVRKKIKKKVDKINIPTELIIKTKPEWIKVSLANKSRYQKKYNEFWCFGDNYRKIF